MNSRIMVEAENLKVRFGDFFAVKNVSFAVSSGEIFGFLGANGAGKTTTIRVLCGLLKPTSGMVRIAGIDYSFGESAIKSKVGYMSQKFTLYNDMTVSANLDFTASLRKIPPRVYRQQRASLLDFISFSLPLDTKVHNLPSGVKQQVSLVAALLHDPDIIFLDEPTAGVTPAARAAFWQLIRKLKADGKTLFVTTHYMDEAEYCDRIALMKSGELIALDSPKNLKQQTFPLPVYELDPKGTITAEQLSRLQQSKAVRSLTPYGIRYHLVLASESAWQEALPEFDALFALRRITPSLEDVFIELVEARSAP
jgi:ABC-2 type transport system ATP-binding protein